VVNSATQIATLDPTAFALADRSLLDFTGGISALVQGRLAGADANGRPASGAIAVSYTPDDRKLIGKAPAAGYAAPYVVWTEGFGGTRTQKATDDLLRATSTTWGGVIGVDQRVRGDLLLGAFVGGGTSRLAVDQGSQRIDTDHVVGGVYGRFDWVSQFFDFKLQAGGSDNTSTRQVFSNLALPNGLENASAQYGGWFISPELGYGLRYGLGSGYTLTPMARVRYVAGVLDGFSETGSGQGLSVGRRTLQNVEERGEIELARTSQFGLADTIRTYMHGGVIALQRVGDTTVSTTLIGQSFNFATPGKDSATGAVAGAGFDLTLGGKVSVFGAVEGTVMSDKSRTGMAKGGMRVAF
jgi:outer membrane autotransporter protein